MGDVDGVNTPDPYYRYDTQNGGCWAAKSRPAFWPASEPWPIHCVGIERETNHNPPVYFLSDGRTVMGEKPSHYYQTGNLVAHTYMYFGLAALAVYAGYRAYQYLQ